MKYYQSSLQVLENLDFIEINLLKSCVPDTLSLLFGENCFGPMISNYIRYAPFRPYSHHHHRPKCHPLSSGVFQHLTSTPHQWSYHILCGSPTICSPLDAKWSFWNKSPIVSSTCYKNPLVAFHWSRDSCLPVQPLILPDSRPASQPQWLKLPMTTFLHRAVSCVIPSAWNKHTSLLSASRKSLPSLRSQDSQPCGGD